MSYEDYGYDQFLGSATETNNSGVTGISFDQENTNISGNLIQGGIIQSANKKSTFDLEQGFINISDGTTDIIQLGKLSDGSYGLIIRDRDGNELLHFTGDINLIQSPGKNMVLDFNTTQLTIFDEGLTPIVLLGKLSG